MKNGKSRETGNNGYTRHSMKKHKTKYTTQKTKQMSSSNILAITIPKHTQTTQTYVSPPTNICEPPYKQLDVKTNRTSFVCGHRNFVAVQIKTTDREICQHNVIIDLTYSQTQKEWVFY